MMWGSLYRLNRKATADYTPPNHVVPVLRRRRMPDQANHLLDKGSGVQAFVLKYIYNIKKRKETNMLWTIFVILLILWLLGLISGYTMGGIIHILLVIAIVVVLVRVIQGRKAL